MRKSFLVFAALIIVSIGQIIVPPNLTLLDASQSNSTYGPIILKAFIYILEAHPELQNYTVLNVREEGINATSTDQYVTLRGSDNSTIIVAVSIESNLSTFFVSFSKFDSINGQSANAVTLTSNLSVPSAITNNIQTSQAILSNQNQNSSNAKYNTSKTQHTSYILGGYHTVNNFNDPKFLIAVGYLRRIHSNIINYRLLSAEYQIVTGINFIIKYIGLNQMTQVSAKIYLSLSGLPTLTEFNVSCSRPFILDCTDDTAHQIYYGTELVIDSHTQLQDYRLISLYIQEATVNYLTFMATFQNQPLLLRAISEIIVSPKILSILSFYSYRYQ